MKENFAIKLRELRKASGMTQEQLAAEFGVSVQAVSKWETAASYPDIELMPRIADSSAFHWTSCCAMLRTRKTLMRVKKFIPMPNSNAMLPATRNRLKSNTRTKTTMKMPGTMKKTMTMKMMMTMKMTMKKMMTAAASL